MANIYGQIESLKKIKKELKSNGIHRFNSIKELNEFLHNFQNEEEAIVNYHRETLNNEIINIKHRIEELKEQCETIKNRTVIEIDFKIESVSLEIKNITSKVDKSIIHKIFFKYRLKQKNKLLEYYCNNSELIILNTIKNIQDSISVNEKILDQTNQNSENIIIDRSSHGIRQLNYIKDVITNLQHTLAGAVGENLVVKEIEKLSDDYILINDFNLKFNPPIYNRNTKDKIFSIQIDHLLISKSGIFIIETKNWSKRSIESLDLRSPVEQITRTSYALFVLLNDSKIRLTEHHWGHKQIPIKNVIVMINEKPKEDFKFVKVKTIKELNNYLTYFEPIFSQKEVDKIAKYLIDTQNLSNPRF
jgi:hypothetical protein